MSAKTKTRKPNWLAKNKGLAIILGGTAIAILLSIGAVGAGTIVNFALKGNKTAQIQKEGEDAARDGPDAYYQRREEYKTKHGHYPSW